MPDSIGSLPPPAPPLPARPRAVVLDFYGTLVQEDYPIVRQIIVALAAAAGRDAAEIAPLWTRAYREWSDRAHGAAFIPQREVARGSLAEVAAAVGAEVDVAALLAPQFAQWQAPPPLADAGPFLAALAAARLPVAIVSNIDTADLTAAIAHQRFAIPIPLVITSEDVRAYKPRPEPFMAALARLGCAPAEVVHIGDSRSSDIAGAAALGMPVIWLNRLGAGPPAVAPSATLPDLRGVPALLGLAGG